MSRAGDPDLSTVKCVAARRGFLILESRYAFIAKRGDLWEVKRSRG